MNIPFVQAKKLSYSGTRSYSNIYYIIIHYTGINNDTAENEAKFFATGNTRSAGAHFFVGQNGHIVQSVKMMHTANSVPRKRQGYSGGGWFLGKCTSANSISIELCDNLSRDPSAAQIEAVRQLIAYIQSICQNAKSIVRHYDVTGKLCPARMTDVCAADAKKWAVFLAAITSKPSQTETVVKEDEIDMTKDEVQKMIEKSVQEALKGSQTKVSEWFEEEYAEAKDAGITDGTRPGGYATREQTAVMIIRAVKYVLNQVKAILKAGGEID